jgi:hypothetical protein
MFVQFSLLVVESVIPWGKFTAMELGDPERERGRCSMRQVGMSSLSPPHIDRPLRVSKGGEHGMVVAFSGQTGRVMILK